MGFALAACPGGWTDFAAGAGRFLIGVGTDGQGNAYALGSQGGEALHRLTIAEMPSHHHQQLGNSLPAYQYGTDWWAADGAGASTHYPTGITSDSGGDQPHENRPPYIAVRWCVKS